MIKAQPRLRGWSTESDYVTRWKDESWFPQLLEIKTEHNLLVPALPRSGTSFTLRESKEQYLVIDEKSPQVPYVSLEVPEDVVQVNKITFATESHDQSMLPDSLLS